MTRRFAFTISFCTLVAFIGARVHAEVPADIEAGLKKIGQIVDPACTAKLYRPLMPKNDYNTYWPVGASAPSTLPMPLYPGVMIARDVSFGTNPKDLIDIFSPETGRGNRAILIYVPGGQGNKIEQQALEGNAFYDNIAPLGGEEQHDRRHDATASRRELGRWRQRHFHDDPMASGEHREVQRQSGPDVHMGALSREWAAWSLYRPSGDSR